MAFEIVGGTVYFVGAGPGAVDLMTVRGRTLIEAADLILFADSLVDCAHAERAKPGARIVGSSGLSLEGITALLVDAARSGGVVVRLQSGDPSVYGAVHEQMVALRAAGVPYVMAPGVNSALAAAAALGLELTVPDLAQTVIMTRTPGRAGSVPDGESLRSLAAHGATIALFLSASLMATAVTELIEGGYAPTTPAAVAYHVSWDDERLIRCPLAAVPATVQEAGITRSCVVLLGPALGADSLAPDARSHLYDPAYSHRYRQGRTAITPASDAADTCP
jgi:precorrin-4 C11-methyltransferase